MNISKMVLPRFLIICTLACFLSLQGIYSVYTEIVESKSVSQQNFFIDGCGKLNIQSNSKKIPWVATFDRRSEIIDESWSAVIITQNLILTGIGTVRESSGVLRISPYELYTVSTNISAFQDDGVDTVKSKITHLRLHPNYQIGDLKYVNNGYVLVHLRTPLPFSSHIYGVCLPSYEDVLHLYDFSNSSEESYKFSVIGWDKYFQTQIRQLIPSTDDDCQSIWMQETMKVYEHRICANISEERGKECIEFQKAAIAVNDLYNMGMYYFMGLIFDTVYKDCSRSKPVYIQKLNNATLQWIYNNIRCGPNQYTCNNGDCISLEGVCNGTSECADTSDEDFKFCQGIHYCENDEFTRCGIHDIHCVTKDKICDSIKDCYNGEDEKNCPTDILNRWKIITPFVAIFIIIVTTASIGIYRMKKNTVKVRDLTVIEIKEFQFGSEHSEIHQLVNTEEDSENVREDPSDDANNEKETHADQEYLNNLTKRLRWDGTFEIPKSMISINKRKILGSGEYGIVYGGQLFDKNDDDPYQVLRNVAVKTLNSCPDIEHFKALLLELKVLVYVGQHENTVQLIGANTEDIKLRNLLIVMEFCTHGSLKDYLNENKHSFLDLVNSGGITNATDFLAIDEKQKKIDTLYLIRWCRQIANAMDYLTSKHVIHGDLAARNVLLSYDFTAKVGDFGLSRKLYEYRTNYSHTNKVKLPLKWMSIESIKNWEFSHKSDVWSYGVTIWEIFTLGCTPYENTNLDADFYNKLCSGLRPNKPMYATEEIYNLMRACWNAEPSERPCFQDLRKNFLDFDLNFTELDTSYSSADYVTISV